MTGSSHGFVAGTASMVAAAGIAVFALLYLVLLPRLFDKLNGLPDGFKIILSVLLIAPLAFCMGALFPIGLRRVAGDAPDFIPWVWGINGFATVVSASLATLLAIAFGFTTVVLLALGLYVVAAVIICDRLRCHFGLAGAFIEYRRARVRRPFSQIRLRLTCARQRVSSLLP